MSTEIPPSSALSRYVDDLIRQRDEQKIRADAVDKLNADLHVRVAELVDVIAIAAQPPAANEPIEKCIIEKLRDPAGWWKGDANARRVLRHYFPVLLPQPAAPVVQSEGSAAQ